MSVRRSLPYVLALLLGMSTALLVACGGGTKSGIPSASAGELKSQITDVGQAVDSGRCKEVQGQLRQVDQGIDQLPKTTDGQLVSALRNGADRLRRVAVDECDTANGTQTTTTDTTPQTDTTTDTAPQQTGTTDTTPTDTTGGTGTTIPTEPPPATTPTPPPVTPPPVTAPSPPPPPVTPGGGVTPTIPPG
jgi:cell division protein FtsN